MHTTETRRRALLKIQKRRRDWLKANGPCSCGSTRRLEVHHRDPDTKVSHKIWSWSDERRATELAKCEAKCRTCHEEHHAKAHRRHGLSAYAKRGCRCSICVEAKRVESARYRRAKMNREEFKEQMTTCQACGRPCDGDVCDDSCAALLGEADEAFDPDDPFEDEDEEDEEDEEEELD